MLCWKAGPTKEPRIVLSMADATCTHGLGVDALTLFVQVGLIIFIADLATAIETVCKSESFS